MVSTLRCSIRLQRCKSEADVQMLAPQVIQCAALQALRLPAHVITRHFVLTMLQAMPKSRCMHSSHFIFKPVLHAHVILQVPAAPAGSIEQSLCCRRHCLLQNLLILLGCGLLSSARTNQHTALEPPACCTL